VLLSAVAPSREIAASYDVFSRLARKERVSSRPQENAVLHALSTARRGQCVLIAGPNDELRGELDGQVDKLIAAVPSTSSPSTF
jgi:hypothetical protein